jgi:hypothetical protein
MIKRKPHELTPAEVRQAQAMIRELAELRRINAAKVKRKLERLFRTSSLRIDSRVKPDRE